jgi:hypothetical protein
MLWNEGPATRLTPPGLNCCPPTGKVEGKRVKNKRPSANPQSPQRPPQKPKFVDELEKLVESPRVQSLRAELKKLAESPRFQSFKQEIERYAQSPQKLAGEMRAKRERELEQEIERERQERERRKKGGRPPLLSPALIQEAQTDLIDSKVRLRPFKKAVSRVVKFLATKRVVFDEKEQFKTIVRWIIRPLLVP